MSDEFDRATEYDVELEQGLRLSGEHKDYFAAGRIRLLLRLLPGTDGPGAVLDFGCGVGDTTVLLQETFPEARIVGTDTADGALELARLRHGDRRARFLRPESIGDEEQFDLVYVNGVFHHIRPEDRGAALTWIVRRLVPGGRIALFENNPWNPGARWVMRRIPFDRDAEMLSVQVAEALLREAGLEVVFTRSLFWFPRWLSWLRPLERRLEPVPLGAQYLVLARRGTRSGSDVGRLT